MPLTKTGQLDYLKPKTQAATDYFIQKNIINHDETYTYKQALKDAGYSPHYILRFGPKISNNIIVKQQIEKVRQRLNAAIVRKVVLTREKQVSELDKIKNLAEKDGSWDAAIAAIKEQNVLCGLRIADAPADSEEAERLSLERKKLLEIGARLYIESKVVENAHLLPAGEIPAAQDSPGLTNDTQSDVITPPEQAQ